MPVGPKSPLVLNESEVKQFAGNYEIAMVTTVDGHPRVRRAGKLQIIENDSLSRYFVKYMTRSVRRGNRILAGKLALENEASDTVTMDTTGLTFGGCQFPYCSDGAVTSMTILELNATGFRGRWERNQWATNFVPTDAQGRFMPNPGGHFCARRESP